MLGSCLSISLSLAAVMVIFLVLGDEYPRVTHEFRGLECGRKYAEAFVRHVQSKETDPFRDL